MKRFVGNTVLLALLMSTLVITWSNDSLFTTSSSHDLFMQIKDQSNFTSAASIAKSMVAELGWSQTLKIGPFVLAYAASGILGLFALFFVSCFGILILVYLLAQRFSTPSVAQLTQFIFVLSPVIIKYPYDTLSLFSQGFLSLLAINLSLIWASSSSPTTQRLLWIPISGICVLLHKLTGWGIWLPILIGLFVSSKRDHPLLKLAMFFLIFVGFVFTAKNIYNSALSLLAPETPLRTILLAPNAIQVGYSDIIPKELTFQLPGNNPAILLLFLSPWLRSKAKSPLYSYLGVWLAISILGNFGLLLTNPGVALASLTFPISLITAEFFKKMLPAFSTVLLSLCTTFFLLFSTLSFFEPALNEIVVSFRYPGWSTLVPFRDTGQILGGIMIILVFLYIYSQETAPSKENRVLLHIIFLFFGISQISLMSLL